MAKEVLRIIKQINEDNRCFLAEIKKGKVTKNNIDRLLQGIDYVNKKVPDYIVNEYQDFFHRFSFFCNKSFQNSFTKEKLDMLKSSLELYIECVEVIKEEFSNRIKKCICCNREVVYYPISKNYRDMTKQYETLNQEEYSCPRCGASDRDRLIISFLKKQGIEKAQEGTKVLQFAPAKAISDWIELYCPHVEYRTTDLYMKRVTFQSDIQNMHMVEDHTYDVIICSHILEHVQDDEKAMAEMKRILKPDGKLVFLAPINLNQDLIDEEWGLSEAENIRRFGQGDHCRMYGKKGLLERLSKYFYIHSLDIKYFGEELFRQCGLTDTSVLYVLTKSEEVPLSLEEEIVIDHKLCQEGPLVSVILPCYNHEEYVAETIESILGQSYKNIEIIAADDCSTDGTAEILRKYSSYFAKEIYLSQNTGAAIAHEMFKYANGKYVALAHSDDLWERDKLALQVEYMEKHPECGICFTWCRWVDDDLKENEGRNTFIKGNQNQYEWMKYFWEKGNALCHSSSLSRTDVALKEPKYGYNLWRQFPDYFKWVDRIQECPIHIIPKVLVKMHWHVSGVKENTSVSTHSNTARATIEEGSSWINVIRDMSTDFFKKAFYELMLRPEAQSEDEIKCEKFFLLLKHRNMFVQNSAFTYLCEVYAEIDDCLKKEYGYSRSDLSADMINKGLVPLLEIYANIPRE